MAVQVGVIDTDALPHGRVGPGAELLHQLFNVAEAVRASNAALDAVIQPLDAANLAVWPAIDCVLAADALEDRESHAQLLPCLLHRQVEKRLQLLTGDVCCISTLSRSDVCMTNHHHLIAFRTSSGNPGASTGGTIVQ